MPTKFIIILFLLVGEFSYGQLFQQDFSSSTSVNSYVHATNPTVNQFNSISNFGNASSTITNNALRFSKKGASSAFFVRTTPMAAVAPDFVKFQFKIKISEPVTLDNYTNCNAALYVGDGNDIGFSDPTQVTAPVAASIHTKLDLKLLIAAGSAKFSINGKEYSGEQTITLFINNTGDTIPKYYTTPGGYKSMVANDKFDVWVGNELVVNEENATTATAAINKFKFILPSCAPNAIIDIDNIEIRGDAAEASELWLSTVKYQVPSSEIYLGSPSILKLNNGDILVAHDYFGAKGYRDAQGRSNRTSVYKSADNGQTWSHLTDISGAYWANLFKHKGAIYLLGTTSANGSIAIRKSTDGGLTWTQPTSATTGLLLNEGASLTAPRYHGAPTPIAKAGGRLYRAFENVEDLTAAGFRGYRSFVVSIDENDDLLDATKWTKSNELTFNGTWDPPGSAGTTGWIEGNAVVGPDGNILNMLRVNSTPFFDRSALQAVSNNGQTISFNASSDFINFPGGSCKFVVRKDSITNIYWAMLNDNTNGVEPNQRNVLALYASLDLRNWYPAKTLIEDNQGYTSAQSIALTGFQYPDWQFDGNDIIYLSRTAYGDGVPRAHDSNYITFGRVGNYRCYTPEAILEILGVPDNYGQLFYQDFESSTDKADYIGSGANLFGSIHSANSSSTTSAIETEVGNKFLRFNKTGNTTSVVTRGITFNNTSSIAVLKFRFRFAPSVILSTTQSDILAFFLGDETKDGEVTTTYFNDNDTNNPPAANLFYTVNLRGIKSTGQAGTTAGNDYVFASATNTYFPVSDWNEITIVANNTTGPLTYRGPNGSNYMVTPTTTDGGATYTGRGDVWIGTTRVAQNVSLGAMKVLNKFKIRIPTGFPNGTIDIDDIRIYRGFSVLPVTFTSFTGRHRGSSAQLNWQTGSESNNSHFNILSAGENRKFIKIGEIKGSGNTNISANYSFTDYNPVSGTNYYRLQQVDLNNTVNEYGEIVSVKMESGQKESFVINSFDDGSLTIGFHAARESIDGRITITDVSGRQLASKYLTVRGGYNEVKIAQYLQKGVYVVSLFTDGKTISMKFIK